jgi:hypothetical protein
MEGKGTGVAMGYLRVFILLGGFILRGVIFREVIRTIGILSRTFLRGSYLGSLRLRLLSSFFFALLVVHCCLRRFG